ncbi:hypothetical protein Dsin_021527 [Dipteronia sinensis]|uniref:RNase H type-1 domain-containing protein n=1 Tax=Dipteronia sinensis TaxID=43782 RepID=A0AAE0A0U1_9ROSI|nr:hypothetical protein Dsin_021527 [Dipteronia sinensis]
MINTTVVPCSEWTAPPPGLFKLNTDVAIRKGALMIGLCAAIRDEKGKVVIALSKPLPGNFNDEIEELLALREGLLRAKIHKLHI